MKKVLCAFEEGEEVENAESWKNRAFAAQSVASVLGAGVAIAGACGYRIDLSADQVATVAGGLVTLVGAVSAVINVVTTKRIGWRRKCR